MLNRVNYRVKEVGNKVRKRVVHINSLKKFVEREEVEVNHSVVVDEEECQESNLSRGLHKSFD